MKQYLRKLLRLHKTDRGTTATEYAVMLAMIVLIAFKAMQLCGFEVQQFFDFNADEIGNAF